MPNFLVNTDKNLKNILPDIENSKVLGIDTEFIRESSYFPKLALLQIATTGNIYCIDVINIQNDAHLKDIFINKSIKKVIHSSKQDLESIYSHFKCYPANIFDTQIAYNFLYNETNPSYSKLVKKYFNISLKEGSWRTDWLSRPLSKDKLEYASNDAKYLIDIYNILEKKLKDEDRYEWCEEEFISDLDKGNVIIDPKDTWKKINIPNYIDEKQLDVIKSLSELRENYAIEKDIPRKCVMPDSFILKISFSTIKDIEKVMSDTKTKLSRELFKEVETIIMRNQPRKSRNTIDIDLDKYNTLVSKCYEIMDKVTNDYNISSTFIANKKDIDNFARGYRNVRFLKGWRFNIFGKLVQ